ncbi:MAG: calcium/sodium antiporter [Thermoplasmatota archaeon]
MAIPAFIGGILFLYKGSDVLVDGTSRSAAQLGVPSLIISVIVVAFGTSAPEFAISFGAALQNHADISIGNIIGSCVANLLLVIGLSAIIKPVKIQKGVILRELPIMMLVTVVFVVFSLSGLLDQFHLLGGVLFLLFFVLFVWYFISCAKKERVINDSFEKGDKTKNALLIIGGIIGVVIGAWLLIESAVAIAHFFGIPEMIIALSMVAIGTSLPELVVSAVASFKDESDIAVGNVLGSNVFNIFLVIGAAALLIPLNAQGSVDHLIILLLVTAVMFPILRSGHQVSRIEGVFLLGLYIVFIWYTFFGYVFF